MRYPFRRRSDVAHTAPIVQRQFAAGRLIAYPTETCYGLGGPLTDAALDLLAALKTIPADKPLLLLVSSRAMLGNWGFDVGPREAHLIDQWWPGPLTLILPNRDLRLPRRLRSAAVGVAVRWTSHPVVASLIEHLGHPLVSTSANPTGHPAARDVDTIERYFERAIRDRQLEILDGGTLTDSPPSTILDCTGPVLSVVREGVIPSVALLAQESD